MGLYWGSPSVAMTASAGSRLTMIWGSLPAAASTFLGACWPLGSLASRALSPSGSGPASCQGPLTSTALSQVLARPSGNRSYHWIIDHEKGGIGDPHELGVGKGQQLGLAVQEHQDRGVGGEDDLGRLGLQSASAAFSFSTSSSMASSPSQGDGVAAVLNFPVQEILKLGDLFRSGWSA